MLENYIEKFIVSGCSEEVQNYKSISGENCILERDKNQWSYIVEIMIITIKSLIPSDYGSVIDYERFNEELKLWYYYRHGGNNCLLGSLNSDERAYWEYEDDSIFSRIVPIVFANEDWIVARDEVLKNILYTTGIISSIFEGLSLAKLLSVLISNFQISYDDIISQIKEEIVCFSQKEFMQHNINYFKFSPNTYKGNYIVVFERKRIELLNVLNGIGKSQEYNTLKQSLDILQEPEKDNEQSSFLLAGLKGLMTSYETNHIKDEVFIKNLCSFLVKLRKGRIAAESLHVENYILPDVFQYNEGDIFFHSLLKKCQVIKKIKESNLVISYIRTKSGVYSFWKN